MSVVVNPDLFAAILAATVRAERFFLRAQFEADSQDEVQRAIEGRRHALGLRAIVEKWGQSPQGNRT